MAFYKCGKTAIRVVYYYDTQSNLSTVIIKAADAQVLSNHSLCEAIYHLVS